MATHGIDNTLKVPPSPTEPHTTATALMPPQRVLRRRRRPQRPGVVVHDARGIAPPQLVGLRCLLEVPTAAERARSEGTVREV